MVEWQSDAVQTSQNVDKVADSISKAKAQVRPKFSLVVITLNEERNIERCLKSVPFADDIIVLDSGSVDSTCDIAKKLGARVIIEPFRGFREQKQRATDLAVCDWIISLDADEVLSPSLQKELLSLYETNSLGGVPREKAVGSVVAFRIPRLSFYLGRWIRHGGWYPDYQTRIFNRKKVKWIGGHVHERVEIISGGLEDLGASANKIITLTNPIEHFVFRDIEHQVATNNLYSSKGALDLFERKKAFSMYWLLTKPISKFIETFFFKLGFLDGLPGYLISVSAAYSIFLKFAKLWELEKFKSK